jgi:hypothetical protein
VHELVFNMWAFKVFLPGHFISIKAYWRTHKSATETLPRNIFDIILTAGAHMQSIRYLNSTASQRRSEQCFLVAYFFLTRICVTTNKDETRISPCKFLRVWNLICHCEGRTRIEYKLCGIQPAMYYVYDYQVPRLCPSLRISRVTQWFGNSI